MQGLRDRKGWGRWIGRGDELRLAKAHSIDVALAVGDCEPYILGRDGGVQAMSVWVVCAQWVAGATVGLGICENDIVGGKLKPEGTSFVFRSGAIIIPVKKVSKLKGWAKIYAEDKD